MIDFQRITCVRRNSLRIAPQTKVTNLTSSCQVMEPIQEAFQTSSPALSPAAHPPSSEGGGRAFGMQNSRMQEEVSI